MPNIKSAKKRVKVLDRRKTENKLVKSSMATAIKKFKATVSANLENADKELNQVFSIIDSAESKKVIHKNNADRKKTRLSVYLNKLKTQKQA